jgi:hypothetical protein
MIAPTIASRRLLWVGPATIVASTAAVTIVQHISLALLPSLPPFSGSVLKSHEPAAVTAALVTIGVGIFGFLANSAEHPLSMFRRVAFAALVLSLIPNVLTAWLVPGAAWLPMIALMIMHVVAWAVCTTMLTCLTTKSAG